MGLFSKDYSIPISEEYLSILEALGNRDEVQKFQAKIPLKNRKKYLKNYAKRERQVFEKNLFIFRKYKLKSIEDLVDFLASQYLMIDEVAIELISDPLFFVWLKRNTANFTQAIGLMAGYLNVHYPKPLAEL